MKYKVKSPFRYPGGKFYALKYLLPYIESIPHLEYREPFVGGGAVFFGKKLCDINWINDIDSDLINTYKIIKHKGYHSQLVKKVGKETASKERHAQIREIIPKDSLEKAFKYFYLNRTSYCGIMKKPAWGYKDGKSSPPINWGDMIKKAKSKLENTKVTCLDFEDVIKADSKYESDKVLLYLDPPYLVADQKRAYENSFDMRDHLRLCNLLKKTNYYFILSYDNSPQIRKIYEWANIIELTWNYNTSNLNGHKNGRKRKKGQELLITNFSF